MDKFRIIFQKYPIVRGMLSYSIIWPGGNLLQQTIHGENFRTYNYKETLRFCIYGTLFVAPSLHGWIRLAGVLWPNMTLRSGIMKASVEQLTYGPFAGCSFFFLMSMLEMKTLKEAIDEVRSKFFFTYKVGLCYWPIIQTINFSIIPERNRVPFVSIASLVWTTFLTYMKHLEAKRLADQEQHHTIYQRDKAFYLNNNIK